MSVSMYYSQTPPKVFLVLVRTLNLDPDTTLYGVLCECVANEGRTYTPCVKTTQLYDPVKKN